MDDFVVLNVYGSRIEAETAKTLLDANSINSLISSDDSVDVEVAHAPPASKGYKLLVTKHDLEKAQDLFKPS